jgi:hypothetical protein
MASVAMTSTSVKPAEPERLSNVDDVCIEPLAANLAVGAHQ